MKFINFVRNGCGLTNQIFSLIRGVESAIINGSNVVVIDKFLCQFKTNIFANISDVLDLEEINKYTKKKYGIILVDRYNYNFELLNVTYGSENNKIDITQIIKKKYYCNNKLFIAKNTKLNDIQDVSSDNLPKYIWVKYNLNDSVVIDKYDGKITKNIDYTNDNYEPTGLGWPSRKFNRFEDILLHIIYKKKFHDISNQVLSKIILTKKVNLIHLRLENDAIAHWSRMNKMTTDDFKTKLECLYIKLIQENINKNDTTIILASSFDNKVIEYLNLNNYNYFNTSEKMFEYRELNAIIDLIISKQCNNVFIGNFNFNGMNGSTFSCYIKKIIPDDIIYKYIDLDHI